MALLFAFLSYLGKYILFIIIAIAGVLAGKTFKRHKTNKNKD